VAEYDIAKVAKYVKGWMQDIALIMESHRQDLKNLKLIRKKDGSWVTAADLEIHELVLSKIQHYFPDHQIMSEENIDEFEYDPSNPYLWSIDPIDGTHEYMKADSTYFCSSIALYHNMQPVLAFVYAPAYTEYAPHGALFEMHADIPQSLLNGQPIQIGSETDLQKVAGDINQSTPHPKFEETLPQAFPNFKPHYPKALALQTCKIAASGTHPYSSVFVQHEAKMWDMAAAIYICQGAGATAVDLQGNPQFPLKFVNPGRDPNFRIPTLLIGNASNVAQVVEFLKQ
jgi:fructose-1,6-bisphosphatase/inositol monophosphatase family enzyme